MRVIFMVLLSILLFCIQSTILKDIQIRGIVPNLMLILVVSYGIFRGGKSGRRLGLFVGVIQDVLFYKFFGVHALIYFYIGHLSGYFNKDFYKENYILPLVLIMVMDFILGIYIYVFTFLFRGRIDIEYYLYNIIFPEMIYTMLVSIFMYRLLYLFHHKLVDKEGRFRRFKR